MQQSRRPCLILVALLMMTAAVRAHPPVATVAVLKVSRDHRVVVTVVHDALAFALNDTSARIADQQMYDLLDGPAADLAGAFADGRERFPIGFRLAADGVRLPVEVVESPGVEGVRQWERGNPSRRLPCKLEFVVGAELPAGSTSLTVRFPEVLAEVIITVERPGLEPLVLPLAAGEESPAIDVGMATTSGRVPPHPPASPPPGGRATDRIGAAGVAWRFVKLGFSHIVPGGPDHCLFVLGLFLLIPRVKPVLWQISAFTVAHTITLTLTSLHIVGLPARIVEPTIAASIAFIGVENLLTRTVHPWRIAVAFLFGLVHGMGVATAFNEAGFPPGQLVNSLASFTVGVEGGHIAVLGAAFLFLGWSRNKPWYRRRVAIPLSVLIAAIALVWTVQRVISAV